MNARKLFTIVLTAGLVPALGGAAQAYVNWDNGDLGELVNSYIATREVLGDAHSISSGLQVSNTLIKTDPGTLTLTGGEASANFKIDDGPITVTADSSLAAGVYAGYADGLAGEQYVQVGSNKNPLSIASGSTLTLGRTNVYTLTVVGQVINGGDMTVNQGTVQTTGGGSLTIGATRFQADNNTAFQVTGEMTATSAENIRFSSGTVTVTGGRSGLVEGTSTTLDLTGYIDAGIGDPLPLTYHPGNDPAFLTIESSFVSEAEFKTSWPWDLAGEWAILEDENDDQ